MGEGAYNRTQINVSNLNKVYRNADQTLLTSNSCLKLEGGLWPSCVFFLFTQVDGPITKGEGVKKMKHTVFPLLLSPPEDPQDKYDHFLF